MKHWNLLLRKVVESSTLEMISRSPFQPQLFYNSVKLQAITIKKVLSKFKWYN